MPTGLIEQDDRVRPWGYFGCDLVEMKLHGFGIAGRQYESGTSPALGTDGTKQVRFGALIMSGARAGAVLAQN